jgi:Kef-type K+ transport system membrane component KefB
MEFSWLNLFLVVLVSWFAGALVMRLSYPHVLGELLAGIIFGPPLLGWIRADAGIVLLGRVGILMMVLFIDECCLAGKDRLWPCGSVTRIMAGKRASP